MKFRKRPIVIEATQWFKNGDHPDDECILVEGKHPGSENSSFLCEGKVVRYFYHPTLPNSSACELCGCTFDDHGFIATLEGGHIVCPGDWIITGVEGERYPCKPGIFEKTYEPVIEPIYLEDDS